jgi:hypothetical protein
MALGTNLATLLGMLRAEARLTQSVAAGLNADQTHRVLLARHQDDLWTNFDWKHLLVDRDVVMQSGVRLYAFPADLSYDRTHRAQVKWGYQWRDLTDGVDESHYNQIDPDLGATQDPPMAWDLREGNVLEVWPTPATDGTVLRLTGTLALPPLVADSDTAILDDRLIVLLAAAEILAVQKAPDAQAKQTAAQRRLLALRGNASKMRRASFLNGQRRGFGGAVGSRMEVVKGRGSITWDSGGTWEA